jgi:hypothetical protein
MEIIAVMWTLAQDQNDIKHFSSFVGCAVSLGDVFAPALFPAGLAIICSFSFLRRLNSSIHCWTVWLLMSGR